MPRHDSRAIHTCGLPMGAPAASDASPGARRDNGRSETMKKVCSDEMTVSDDGLAAILAALNEAGVEVLEEPDHGDGNRDFTCKRGPVAVHLLFDGEEDEVTIWNVVRW